MTTLHSIKISAVLALAALFPQLLLATDQHKNDQVGSAATYDFLQLAMHGNVDVVRAERTPRPRSFANTAEWNAIRQSLTEGERRAGFSALLKDLESHISSGGITDFASLEKGQGYTAWAKGSLSIKRQVDGAKRIAQGLAFAAMVTGDIRYVEAARRHLRALAALDPQGATGVKSEDLSARHVAWTLALGLDWLYPYLSVDERRVFVRAISVRMEGFAESLVRGSRPLEQKPLDSHGNEVLGALAEISVLLAGETELANRWMNEFIPAYTRLLSPFGGADGGYANGTAYAVWDLHDYSMRHWDTLKRSMGIDLTDKPWVRNIGRFFVYFIPPGTPDGNFGDAAESAMPGTWALTAHAYADRVTDPLYSWYASQWFQQDVKTLELLVAPLRSPAPASFPEGTPNAAFFADIGATAMHSDLRDRGRTSVYFRSSPYGAVSHAHADQNSFSMNIGGRRILIDSGYYDYFGSPHHYGWTKRTIAHNAITFDGGQGQDDPKRPWGEETSKGKILGFSTSAESDWVVGDATAAYRGAVSSARRGLVFIRPGTVVVFDHLSAAQPRQWEWNIHALNRFEVEGDGQLKVTEVDVRACIDFYANADTGFNQMNRFSAEPERSNSLTRPNQWHAQFKVRQPQVGFRSIAVIDTDCRSKGRHSVRFSGDRSVLVLGERVLTFDGDVIRLENKGIQ